MIDFHNHILPDADDGSKSIEMTLSMIKTASSQGIKTIVNTIHYQHPKMENKDTSFNYVEELKNFVVKEAKIKGIEIDIQIAAEVYFFPNLCELVENPLLTINDYMLIEFPMIIAPENYLETFFNLKLKGVTPILAHPERYRCFQNKIEDLNKCIDMGVILQLDAGSILGHFGKKTQNTAYEMLSRGFCHIIGSDSHNDSKRNFCLKDVYDIIGEYNHDSTEQLKLNSYSLLNDKKKLKQIKVDINPKFSFLKKIAKWT